jgi:hypothetical protein
MEVEVVEAGGRARRLPGSPVEVAPAQCPSLGAGEDEAVGCIVDVGFEMGLQLWQDVGRDGHGTSTSFCLGWPEHELTALELLKLAADLDHPGSEVDVGSRQPRQLAEAKAAPSRQRSIARYLGSTASTSRAIWLTLATGLSSWRSTLAPLRTHGLRAISSSSTAAPSIVRSSR